MPRRRPTTRIVDLIEAGTKLFLEKGYRRAQMSDIAQAMHVAPGTIYLYAESKEALFDAIIRASVSPEIVEGLALPIKTPALNATLSFIREALVQESAIHSLGKALHAGKPKDAHAELQEIVREIYAKCSSRWLALKLLERSALDWPELAAMWFGEHRLRVMEQLTLYFEQRMASGALRGAPHPMVAARLVLEMVAAFAMHCRVDPSFQELGQEAAEATVIDAVVNAYRPHPIMGPPRKKGIRRK